MEKPLGYPSQDDGNPWQDLGLLKVSPRSFLHKKQRTHLDQIKAVKVPNDMVKCNGASGYFRISDNRVGSINILRALHKRAKDRGSIKRHAKVL